MERFSFMTIIDVAQDALSIYSKYISKDAKYSIELPDEIIKTTICNLFTILCNVRYLTDDIIFIFIANICPEDETSIDSNCFNSSKEYVYKHILNK